MHYSCLIIRAFHFFSFFFFFFIFALRNERNNSLAVCGCPVCFLSTTSIRSIFIERPISRWLLRNGIKEGARSRDARRRATIVGIIKISFISFSQFTVSYFFLFFLSLLWSVYYHIRATRTVSRNSTVHDSFVGRKKPPAFSSQH